MSTASSGWDELLQLGQRRFVTELSAMFEHAAWVAEHTWGLGPFVDLDALHTAMVAVMRAAPRLQQFAMIRAQPELAGRFSSNLSREAKTEQAEVGLEHCDAELLARLRKANAAYLDRFGFPFVLALRGRSAQEVLDTLLTRLAKSADQEFEQALLQLEIIARLRLQRRFAKPVAALA